MTVCSWTTALIAKTREKFRSTYGKVLEETELRDVRFPAPLPAAAEVMNDNAPDSKYRIEHSLELGRLNRALKRQKKR